MTLLVSHPYGDSFYINIGTRIELHPATDAWMQGDQYGRVTNIGRKYVHVKMERSGRTRRVTPNNIGRRA